MIEVKGLSKFYGNHRAIDDVSFNINGGEIIGLLGLNGAGKSTILKILATYLAPTMGEVTIDGLSFQNQIAEIRRIIGYLPDHPPLYKEMKVRDFLVFVAKLRNMDPNRINKRLDEVLEYTNLTEERDSFLGHLSHGYQQRVGIAQAMISEPKLLILDEPINGLDPVQIVEMRDLILSLKGQYTVMLSSHILSEITKTCDKILIVDSGQLVAEGSEEQLQRGRAKRMSLKMTWRGHDAVSQLESVDEVEEISVKHHGDRFEATLRVVDDCRGKLARILVEAGCELLLLETSDDGLEGLFMKMVSSDSGEGVQ